MSDSKPPKVKLRWFQFSLRTFLMFILVAGMGFGLLGQRIQRVRNEMGVTGVPLCGELKFKLFQ